MGDQRAPTLAKGEGTFARLGWQAAKTVIVVIRSAAEGRWPAEVARTPPRVTLEATGKKTLLRRTLDREDIRFHPCWSRLGRGGLLVLERVLLR